MKLFQNCETKCCLVNCNAFSFDYLHRFDIVLFQFIILLIIYFVHIIIIWKLPCRNPDCRISSTFFVNRQCFQYRLPNIVVTWAKFLGPQFLIQTTQFCGNLRKVIGKPPNPPSSFLKRWDGNFECNFSVK